MSIYFTELDAHQLHLLPYLGSKEIGGGIKGLHQSPFFLFDDGLQLEDVTYEQQLLTAKWLAHVTAVDTQQSVYEINDICTYHRYLVDDDQFEFTNEFDGLAAIFQCLSHVAYTVARIIG